MFAKYSICECGHPILSESVPLGTEYVVDPAQREPCDFRCGGCGQIIENVPCIFVAGRGASQAGFLPAEIFEIDEGVDGGR